MLAARLSRPMARVAPRSVRFQHSTFEPAGQIKGQGDPTGPNFNKPFIGATTIGILFAGFYVIYGGSQFQNRKHGFPQKPSA